MQLNTGYNYLRYYDLTLATLHWTPFNIIISTEGWNIEVIVSEIIVDTPGVSWASEVEVPIVVVVAYLVILHPYRPGNVEPAMGKDVKDKSDQI